MQTSCPHAAVDVESRHVPARVNNPVDHDATLEPDTTAGMNAIAMDGATTVVVACAFVRAGCDVPECIHRDRRCARAARHASEAACFTARNPSLVTPMRSDTRGNRACVLRTGSMTSAMV